MKHTKAYWIKQQIEAGIEPTFKLPKNASMPLPDNWGDIRREVIGCDGACIECGSDGQGVHHIDKNRLNNEMDNLVYLCWPCHSNHHH